MACSYCYSPKLIIQENMADVLIFFCTFSLYFYTFFLTFIILYNTFIILYYTFFFHTPAVCGIYNFMGVSVRQSPQFGNIPQKARTILIILCMHFLFSMKGMISKFLFYPKTIKEFFRGGEEGGRWGGRVRVGRRWEAQS